MRIDSCASSLYYRYWTGVIDEKISELEKRFSTIPACVTQTPTSIAFPNPVSSGTIDIHLSCNDSGDGSSSLPTGVTSQNMYFGIKDSKVYILNLTVYTNGSKRALIAEASSAGKEVKIWDLSKGSNSDDTVVRIFANTETSDFAFYFASEKPSQSTGVTHFYARKSGDDILFSAEHDNDPSASTITTPTNSFDGTTTASTVCRSASDFDTAGTDCSAFNTNQPTGFDVADGTVAQLGHIGSTTRGIANAQFNTDLDEIFAEDLSAILKVEDSAE